MASESLRLIDYVINSGVDMLRVMTFTLFCLMTTFALAENRRVVNLTAGNYPPYQAENLKHYGVVSRIVVEAFALEGIDVKFHFMSWKRAYGYILRGELDGVGYATKKAERLAHFYYSEPVFQKTRVFFHLKSRPFDWSSMADLAGYRIGAMQGYAYSDEFDQADQNGDITTERVLSHAQNMTKLLRGNRLDIVLTTIDQGFYALHLTHPEEVDRVTYHPKHVQNPDMYLMISKKVADGALLVEKFNRGLATLRAEGKIAQYFAESQRGEYIIEAE
ncbi:substrate-binding periplasmic protein [Thaumasiovibrio subtropicus]|uniref:substrate-binding periplasmic protein n=1 Tax=Thaumasiovibrio subtropicus TaxID=1891207 RepID=UPI000B35A25C|nr:transporter substrate-binding domain-containing protein [Thaumasiovibrio subtropicus]